MCIGRRNVEVSSEKAALALMSEADVESRCVALNALDAIYGITIAVPVTQQGTRVWLQRVSVDSRRRDLVLRGAEGVIGFSGIVEIDHANKTAELYIFMMPGSIGKRLGQELLQLTLAYAKHELNLRKVTLYVTGSNIRATNFYERNGFVREGCLQQHAWHRGQYVDRLIYSIFLSEVTVSSSSLYENLR